MLNIYWKYWCWSSNTLATWYKEPTHQERPWCWERLKAGGEGDDRGWDGWMSSLTQWTWVWANSGRWRTGKPGMLRCMGSQRVGHDWATERLNNNSLFCFNFSFTTSFCFSFLSPTSPPSFPPCLWTFLPHLSSFTHESHPRWSLLLPLDEIYRHG